MPRVCYIKNTYIAHVAHFKNNRLYSCRKYTASQRLSLLLTAMSTDSLTLRIVGITD